MVIAAVLAGVSTTVVGSSAALLYVSLVNTLATPVAPVTGTFATVSSTASSRPGVLARVTDTVPMSHTAGCATRQMR